MANEIVAASSLSAAKTGAVCNSTAHSKNANMTNQAMFTTAIKAIASTGNAFVFTGFITKPRFVEVKNLDVTNYIEIGGDATLTVFKIRLMPGDSCLLPNPQYATSLYHMANTGDCWMSVTAVDS
jgi:hypothetical protein